MLRGPRNQKPYAPSFMSFWIAPGSRLTPSAPFRRLVRWRTISRRELQEAQLLQIIWLRGSTACGTTRSTSRCCSCSSALPASCWPLLVTAAIAGAGRPRRMREQALLRIRGATLFETLMRLRGSKLGP